MSFNNVLFCHGINPNFMSNVAVKIGITKFLNTAPLKNRSKHPVRLLEEIRYVSLES